MVDFLFFQFNSIQFFCFRKSAMAKDLVFVERVLVVLKDILEIFAINVLRYLCKNLILVLVKFIYKRKLTEM